MVIGIADFLPMIALEGAHGSSRVYDSAGQNTNNDGFKI